MGLATSSHFSEGNKAQLSEKAVREQSGFRSLMPVSLRLQIPALGQIFFYFLIYKEKEMCIDFPFVKLNLPTSHLKKRDSLRL